MPAAVPRGAAIWPRGNLHRYEPREAFPAMPQPQVPHSSPHRPRAWDKRRLGGPAGMTGRQDVRDLSSEKGRLPPKGHRQPQEGPKPETLDSREGSGGVLGC